jgi:protein-disulfide isomerase
MHAQPLETGVDHVRGPEGEPLILVYGDYECPYTRKAMRQIEALQAAEPSIGFAYRHFPLTEIHPHALAAATAAEAAALQGRFWDMHDLLFHRQKALADPDLASYAEELGLDVVRFERDRATEDVLARIARDVDSGTAAGVRGTPWLFIGGETHEGGYDAQTLRDAVMALRRR